MGWSSRRLVPRVGMNSSQNPGKERVRKHDVGCLSHTYNPLGDTLALNARSSQTLAHVALGSINYLAIKLVALHLLYPPRVSVRRHDLPLGWAGLCLEGARMGCGQTATIIFSQGASFFSLWTIPRLSWVSLWDLYVNTDMKGPGVHCPTTSLPSGSC